jgi:hypothetical protein
LKVHNGPQAVPDPAATAAKKKAGLVSIALTIVCQMNVSNTFGGAEDAEVVTAAEATYKKACNIVSDLLDEYPGVKDSTLVIGTTPNQQ